MLSQPLFQVCELDGPRLLQGARGEPAHPVVVYAKGLGYLTVPTGRLIDRFSGFRDAFFDIHVLTL